MKKKVVKRKKTLPNPLKIRLGGGQTGIGTFVWAEDGSPGIRFLEMEKTHKVGDSVPGNPAHKEQPRLGEVYIVIENIEAAVVLQCALTEVMRVLFGFPVMRQEKDDG